MVESYGFTISSQKKPGTITAVGTIVSGYKEYGYQILDRTLRLCIGTWEGDTNSLTATIIKGIMQLVVAFGDSMRDDLFIEKVGNLSLRELVRTAKERRGKFSFAETMLMAYNSKLKSPLQLSDLYAINKKASFLLS